MTDSQAAFRIIANGTMTTDDVTRDITPDTTIYIIVGGDEPQWESAAPTPERAAAETIAGIGIRVEPTPFRIYAMSAGDYAEYSDTLDGMRSAAQEGRKVRYDHEEALAIAEDLDWPSTPPCADALSSMGR